MSTGYEGVMTAAARQLPVLQMNARMYSAVSPAAADAWHRLLVRIGQKAGVDWPILEHRPPAPIGPLWARDDLGLVQICGLPWRLKSPPPRLIATPLWNDPRTAGKPVYWSEIVVAAGSPWTRVSDAFGGVAGYTVADSMSGYVAFRSHLSREPAAIARLSAGRPLFREVVGGLITPRGVVEAVAGGRIDIGPVDGYAFALLKATEPALASRVRSIATTAAVPMPPFVSTAPLDDETARRLVDTLTDAAGDPSLSDTLRTLHLTGFTRVAAADHDVLLEHLAASRSLPERWAS